ncbi:MAG TPA: hypothetical protein VGL70_00175 [Candidatus Binatia bacterium]
MADRRVLAGVREAATERITIDRTERARIFFEDIIREPGRIILPPRPPGGFGPAPEPPPPTAPAAQPVDIRPLMASIPIANDGQVIIPDFHNSLRAAVLAIAERLGVGAISPTNTLTFAPNFLRHVNNPEWLLDEGIASKPAAAEGARANARGWFAVQLPDGSRIESMIVRGRRTGTIEQFNVSLLRQRISDPAQTSIQFINVPLREAANPFEETGAVDVSAAAAGTGAGGTAAELTAVALEADFRRVDNDNYKYLVRASLVNAEAAAVAQISSIQIVCREI